MKPWHARGGKKVGKMSEDDTYKPKPSRDVIRMLRIQILCWVALVVLIALNGWFFGRFAKWVSLWGGCLPVLVCAAWSMWNGGLALYHQGRAEVWGESAARYRELAARVERVTGPLQ